MNVEEGLVRPALLEALDDRDVHAFFEHRAAFRSHAEAADVDDVRRVGEQTDDVAVVKSRGDNRQVVQMASAEPGVVGDVVIARLHGRGRELAQEVADAFGHRIDVAGRAGDRLCHHASREVEYAGREIAGFAHGGGEGGADHRLRLLFDHGDQAIPHDLAMDLCQGVGFVRHQVVSRVSSI